MTDDLLHTNNLHDLRLLKAGDVAGILNVSRAFAYRLMQQGKIPTVSIQRTRRVRPEDLLAFIEEQLLPANSSLSN